MQNNPAKKFLHVDPHLSIHPQIALLILIPNISLIGHFTLSITADLPKFVKIVSIGEPIRLESPISIPIAATPERKYAILSMLPPPQPKSHTNSFELIFIDLNMSIIAVKGVAVPLRTPENSSPGNFSVFLTLALSLSITSTWSIFLLIEYFLNFKLDS